MNGSRWNASVRRLELLIRAMFVFSPVSWGFWVLDRFRLLPKGEHVFRLWNGILFSFRAWEKFGDQGLGSLQEIFVEERYNKYYKLEGGVSVVDIGSGIGEYLVYAAKKDASVAGYEMNPERYRASLANLQANGCKAEVTLRNVVSLDDIPGADFLKMDIEGGEFEVFKNTKDFRKFKHIAIEFHDAPGRSKKNLKPRGLR